MHALAGTGFRGKQTAYSRNEKLISLRKQEPSFKSLYFHFPGNYQEKRCVEYIKLDEQNQKTEVLLNCSEDSIKVEEQGEILLPVAI